MIIEKFFPTIVYGKDVQLNNNQLAQDIVNWSNQDKGVSKTNYKGWHSTTDMGQKPEYQQLVTELLRMQKEVYENEHIDRHATLGNMWANINPPGGMNQPHIHPNALFSGVYYVKSPPNCGRLKVMDPRPGIQFTMPIRKPGDPGKDMWRDVNIEPVVGRIIMFPAWLWHSVEENKSNDIRISISFNFIQDGF
jgi:uncharacterized protein (TIGR02466 family)|tara:strand:+ start:2986 stop:3564 length:579 start_codon:yes stop_codon:yes gene_type:complete